MYRNNNFQGHLQNATFRPQGSNYNPYRPYQAQTAPAAPKKSGAKYTKISKGNYSGGTIVNAWNKSKGRGLLTATVAPYHRSEEVVESKAGKTYQKMIATVRYHNTGVEKIIPCLMNTDTRVIVLQDLGMVITPNGSGHTSSGKKVTGYFGTMQKR